MKWVTIFGFKGVNSNLFHGKFMLMGYFSVESIAIFSICLRISVFPSNNYQFLLLRRNKPCAVYFISCKGLQMCFYFLHYCFIITHIKSAFYKSTTLYLQQNKSFSTPHFPSHVRYVKSYCSIKSC
jgi:hypothetical protein